MSGWGKSTGEGVGAVPNLTDTQVGEAAKADTFDTADMKSALPEEQTPVEPADPRVQNHFPASAAGAAHDYDKFSKEAETEWESGAACYEWDGEEGDVGPEFPELELQLFGSPENRISQGIDFSK